MAIAVISAIAVQFHAEIGRASFQPVNFFSFFTIIGNIVGAAVFAGGAFGTPADSHLRDVVRGAATLVLVIVGVVFSALLAGLESHLLPWVNGVVHVVMPAAAALDWYVDPPQTPLTRADAAWWLLLPVLYVAYTLGRGANAHWYPYPFLDVDRIGYPAVAAYLAAIAAFAVLVAWALLAVGGTRREQRLSRHGRG